MPDQKPCTAIVNNGVPPIHCEIAFAKQPKLPEGIVSSLAGGGTCPSGCQNVAESLQDKIEWAPRVDKADKLDYIVAVSSGVISGLIDVVYVGEFSLDRAEAWGKEQIEAVVMRVAKIEGYKGDDLRGAIKHMEDTHPLASDGNTNDFGGGRQHHLRDFSHHFSISGLFFSILTQFTGVAVGTDKDGKLLIVSIPESHKAYLGKNFEEKVAYGTIGWFFHMVSDMAGSSGSLSGGTGVPGPLVSFMKEISALPFFKNATEGDVGFRRWVSKLFNGTFLADRDEFGNIIKGTVRKFDLRSEIGVLGELGRQTLPVLINQCIVRSFYFCRRLVREIDQLQIDSISALERIAPEDILPWGTPSLRRMTTVSSGVFTWVDLSDALVRSLKNKDVSTFFLRVNYAGVATFVIACAVDIRTTLESEALEEGAESPEDALERRLSNLDCLTLDFAQARIMHSLMRQCVVYDIEREKRPKRVLKKRMWLDEWSVGIVQAASVTWAVDKGYFLDKDALYRAVSDELSTAADDSWVWLVAMEAMSFVPYGQLYGGNDATYKGLKPCSDYLADVFCARQAVVDNASLDSLRRDLASAKSSLEGKITKRVAGAAGVVVVTAATGGLAFYFAPAIAPALAAALGAGTAGLHGAALTSASLAFLGGGALAAGGAGMAGGTMLIVGGGALLGAVGGAGVSATTTMALATNGRCVPGECAKLLVFCKEVLIKRYGNCEAVEAIHTTVNKRILELETEMEAIRRSGSHVGDIEDGDRDAEDEINQKKMLKIMNRSVGVLKKTQAKLAKLICNE